MPRPGLHWLVIAVSIRMLVICAARVPALVEWGSQSVRVAPAGCRIASLPEQMTEGDAHTGWSFDPIQSFRLVVRFSADLIRRSDAVIHQVRDQPLGRVRQVVTVIHPETGVVCDERDLIGLAGAHLQ